MWPVYLVFSAAASEVAAGLSLLGAGVETALAYVHARWWLAMGIDLVIRQASDDRYKLPRDKADAALMTADIAWDSIKDRLFGEGAQNTIQRALSSPAGRELIANMRHRAGGTTDEDAEWTEALRSRASMAFLKSDIPDDQELPIWLSQASRLTGMSKHSVLRVYNSLRRTLL
jgi:hypothetical protein